MSTIKKHKLIFASVGSRFPMDRLLNSLEIAIQAQSQLSADAQVGMSSFKSNAIRTTQTISAKEFERAVDKCDIFISHAGMGNVLLAAKFNKPLIIMPRQACFSEHINDHQIDTAEALASRPSIFVANDASELEDAILTITNSAEIGNLSSNEPVSRVKLINSIKSFIDNV